jgi:hypothetical protein
VFNFFFFWLLLEELNILLLDRRRLISFSTLAATAKTILYDTSLR